jgi:hypothetical protein
MSRVGVRLVRRYEKHKAPHIYMLKLNTQLLYTLYKFIFTRSVFKNHAFTYNWISNVNANILYPSYTVTLNARGK